jgi:FAD synthase
MFNPYFDGKQKTLEVFLRKPLEENRNLYGETVKIEILGFLRVSANFFSFSGLLQAIYNDIYTSSRLLSSMQQPKTSPESIKEQSQKAEEVSDP